MTQRHYTRRQDMMITEALEVYRRIVDFNYTAIASTDDERREALDKRDLIDSILNG